jgi:hypothetical protein
MFKGECKKICLQKNKKDYELPEVESGVSDILKILSTIYNKKRTILCDEPNRSFHPGMMKRIFYLLCKFKKSNIIISHSPDILNWVFPMNLIHARMDEENGTILSSLETIITKIKDDHFDKDGKPIYKSENEIKKEHFDDKTILLNTTEETTKKSTTNGKLKQLRDNYILNKKPGQLKKDLKEFFYIHRSVPFVMYSSKIIFVEGDSESKFINSLLKYSIINNKCFNNFDDIADISIIRVILLVRFSVHKIKF